MRAKQTAKNLLSSYHDFNLEPAEVRVVRTLSRTRDWFEPKRFITGAVVIGAIVFVVLVLLFTGNLATSYDWLIGLTPKKEPLTNIMREIPWIFWAFVAVVLLCLFFLPRLAVGRLYLITLVFTVGFLGGHVFW